MALPLIPNATARRLFLNRHALAEPPVGPASGAALAGLIDRIGFVQVDSITSVERAHHMILWSRRGTYKPKSLKRLLESERALWEHWTHDASILPVGLYGHWKHRFARDRDRLVDRWTGWQRDGFHKKFDAVLTHVANHGPVTSADVGKDEARGTGGWWDWHPSKAALEYLWRVGDLAVTRRDGFRKVYDLAERVLPAAVRFSTPDADETLDWACTSALDRLGFATPGELAAYWALIGPDEAKAWAQAALACGKVVECLLEGADGICRKTLIRPATLGEAPAEPATRLRILSPFDPALRDRKRTEALFGFRYRIEVFVPEPQRQFGYYVFPVLEGANLVGRLDAKAQRGTSTLRVTAYWPEPRFPLGSGRLRRLQAELHRLARFVGCSVVDFAPGWQRDPVQNPHP